MGEQILDPPSRLETLDALTRANEVALQEQRNPQTAHLAHSSMFEIVTAQRVMVPRDLKAFIQRIKMLAAVGGENYYYSFPVRSKNKDTGKWEEAPPIEGPTIQLAQDLAREYGNCAVDTKVFDIGDRWVIYARFTDYERGFTQVRPYLQRKAQESIGGKDKGRQQDAAFQIGVSKAIRNVIVKSLDSFADMMFEAARSGLVATVEAKLPLYKERVARRLTELGVPLSRIEPLIGRPLKDWSAHETTRVVVELKSISEGMASPDELWPAPSTFIDPNQKEGTDAGEQRGEAGGSSGDGSASGSDSAGGQKASGDNPGPSASGNDSPSGQAGSGSNHDGVPSGGSAANGDNGNASANAERSSDTSSGSDQPSTDEELSPMLSTALQELTKMHTVELVQTFDEQAKGALSDADYAKFEGARDERIKSLMEKATKTKKK